MAMAIPLRARAIIDRFHAVDPARPPLDLDAAERALAAHLVALGLPPRPVEWATSAEDGFQRIFGQGPRDPRIVWSYWDPEWLTARDAVCAGATVEARAAPGDSTVTAAFDAVDADWTTMREAWTAIRRAAWTSLDRPPIPAAGPANGDGAQDAWDCARDAWRSIHCARSESYRARWAGIWSPFADAWLAGLWLWWVLPATVVAVPRPAIRIVDDRLHCPDGPAVWWPDGTRYWYWRGVRVPEHVIMRPNELTAPQIWGEPNIEVRRVMIERIGMARFLCLCGDPPPAHEDHTGKLYRVHLPDDEPVTLVRVTDPSTRREYFLRVPPTVRSAREAVAWTFNMDPDAWAPLVET
jgi:hypothetical protein